MARRTVKKRLQVRPKAATAQVVGTVVSEAPVSRKWRSHYRRLVGLHSNLLNRKDGLVQDARAEKTPLSLHMADVGTDNYDQDFALSMISSEQDALYEIEEAINRIRGGTYGICELTGKPIEARRLEAIPWTRFSAAAEKQLEGEGAISHTKLGRREQVQKMESSEEGEEEEEE